MMADVPEVLFVCTHNAGRSQMAAALLNHLPGSPSSRSGPSGMRSGCGYARWSTS